MLTTSWTDEELCRIGEAEELQLASVRSDVTFAEAALDAHAAVDDAYHTEYDRYGPGIVGSVAGSEAQALTIRVAPRAS